MTDTKQAAMDFMAAQALAMEIHGLMQGKTVGVISQALCLTLSQFCRTSGSDPHEMLAHLANGALYFMAQPKPETPPSVN